MGNHHEKSKGVDNLVKNKVKMVKTNINKYIVEILRSKKFYIPWICAKIGLLVGWALGWVFDK